MNAPLAKDERRRERAALAALRAIRQAADADFDRNPGRPDAPPELAARFRRAFPPPPPRTEQAA